MENFLGKWIDADKAEGVDELLEKRSDIGKEEKETLKDSKSTYEIAKDGDNYLVKATSTAYPGIEKTFPFSLGVPYGGQALDGGNFQATIRLDGDVMVEEGSHDKWGDYKSYRKITNDIMSVKIELDGTTIEQKMKRI